MSSFLKKPALLEKEEQILKHGLYPDPEKYPHLLPKDDAYALESMVKGEENQIYERASQEQYRDPDD